MAIDKKLSARIQSLAQELQDDILFFTLAIEPDTVYIDSDAYKPPWQLRVNRASRKRVAAHYYATSTFLLCDSNFLDFEVVTKFVGSLTEVNRGFLTDLRAHAFSACDDGFHNGIIEDVETERGHAVERARQIREEELEQKNGIVIAKGVLKSNYPVEVQDGDDDEMTEEELWRADMGLPKELWVAG